ncbi:MAG: M64 family metallopeptidase [Mangrovibacterium sp.]
MKSVCRILVLLVIPVLCSAAGGTKRLFTDAALRIDYLLVGNNQHTQVCVRQISKESRYGGCAGGMVDTLVYGTFSYRMVEAATGCLLFSRGFCPLFQEWQTTPEAVKVNRSFYQVAVLPFPLVPVRFEIDRRERDGSRKLLLSLEIDPDDYFIARESVPDWPVTMLQDRGDPSRRLDLVFLSEGYRAEELDRFEADVSRLADSLFAVSPFRELRDRFNICAVRVPSRESGTDIPGERIYRNTAFNTTFYTFDIPRYLTTTDMKAVHDAASAVPYDHLCLLVNSDRYGGGGFYNFLTVATAGNELSARVLVHELGHALAGLADEYYSPAVAYEEFYNIRQEPWEPNLTTLVDFDRKWKDMLEEDTPVPTPREPRYHNTLGVFEGGGYVGKGIYSPAQHCRMRSNEADDFCPVCRRAIVRAVKSYCQ